MPAVDHGITHRAVFFSKSSFGRCPFGTSDAKIDGKNCRLQQNRPYDEAIQIVAAVVGDVFELQRRKLLGKREACVDTRVASSFSLVRLIRSPSSLFGLFE